MSEFIVPGFGVRGTGFWGRVTVEFDLSDPELELLAETCRCLDRLELLDEAVRADGAMVVGSAGQMVLNPAVAEARLQGVALHRLIAALALPDEDGQSVPSTSTVRARKAATARWAHHNEVRAIRAAR